MSKNTDRKLNGAKIIIKAIDERGMIPEEILKQYVIDQIHSGTDFFVFPDCYEVIVIDPHGKVTKL